MSAAADDGETDLGRLLAAMQPRLDSANFVFVTFATDTAAPTTLLTPVVSVLEHEGTTWVVDADALAHAVARGLTPPIGTDGPLMARITLTVHSSLAAVGLTAAVASALAGVGVGCNVVAGYFHDHLFVPSDRAEQALEVLRDLGVRPAIEP